MIGNLVLAAVWLTSLPAATLPSSPTVTVGKRAAEIDRLIEQLGHDQYVVRARAERELQRLGKQAFDALTAAQDHLDIEIATRASYLIQQIHVKWAQEGDSNQVHVILRNFDSLPEAERLERLKQLVSLPDDAGLQALCRILRFERSLRVSKSAALLAIESLETNGSTNETGETRTAILKSALEGSNRCGCQWIRAQLLSYRQPKQAVAEWSRLIADEERAARSDPTRTRPEFGLALMRQQVVLLEKLRRYEEATALMFRMLDVERGDPESLAQLIDWLASRKSLAVLQEVVQRFGPQIDQNAFLLYSLAQIRDKQGQIEQAETLAKKAEKLNGSRAEDHVLLAFELQEKGLHSWAEREYRLVLELEPTLRPGIVAALQLSEFLHDQARDSDAAEVLSALVKTMTQNRRAGQTLYHLGRDAGTVRARLEYFRSIEHGLKGEFEEQRICLENALRNDSTDADVLIAMYHLHQADEDFRNRTRARIKAAVHVYREVIEEDPGDSNGYNQLAWLVGNTEGDFDEAVAASQMSLELEPATSGYLDTLAHCHYAKQDYASAVKCQQQALKLDPHSVLLGRQLKLFQSALERSQRKQVPHNKP